ncbi:MAG: 4-amino-4-deoxy-L-arabinose transferase [Methylotenera sp.]|nr:MAG: 4-amino-4-deoxy-L-arabinose transferase [Methylotenera sp.]
MNLQSFCLILAGVFLNATAQLFLKNGTTSLGVISLQAHNFMQTILKITLQPYIVAGLMCYVLSVAIWIGALSRVDVSIAYPMLSIGYIVNAIAAWYLFGESITNFKILGMFFIIAGTYFIAKT